MNLSDFPLLAYTLRGLLAIPATASREVAAALKNQIDLDTSSGKDCYGKNFAPLKPATVARGRKPPPMVATGASLDATTVKPAAGAGVVVQLGGHYPHHMKATANRAARRTLPVGTRPAMWTARIKRAVDSAVKRALR